MKVKAIMAMSSYGPYKTGEKYRDLETCMIPTKLKAKHLKARRK